MEKKGENRESKRLGSFLLTEPGRLEINLLELITAQIQLTEALLHLEAAWHLLGVEKVRESWFAISIPQKLSTAHHIWVHMIILEDYCDNTVQTRHAQPVRLVNYKYRDLKATNNRENWSSIKAHIFKSYPHFNTALSKATLNSGRALNGDSSLALDMARYISSACFMFHKYKLHKVKPLPCFLFLLVEYPGICQSSPAPAAWPSTVSPAL